MERRGKETARLHSRGVAKLPWECSRPVQPVIASFLLLPPPFCCGGRMPLATARCLITFRRLLFPSTTQQQR